MNEGRDAKTNHTLVEIIRGELARPLNQVECHLRIQLNCLNKFISSEIGVTHDGTETVN